jgi:hypothetical protein
MARDMRRRLQATQAFAASSPISFDLPVTAVYKEINLSLEVAVGASAGNTGAAPFDRSPLTNIKRIELIADGRDTIKSYDGGMLLDINQWDFGEYAPSQLPDTGAANVGSTTFPLWHNLTIDLGLRGMNPEFNPKSGQVEGGPQMTFLDARKLNTLELRVTFGAGLTDIYTTIVGAPTLDRYAVTCWGHEILDLSRDSTFALNQETMTSTAFPTTTATDRQFRLNVGNAYRRIFVSTVDSNARAAVDRIGALTVQENGTFNRRVFDAGMLKSMMATRHQLAVGLDPANPATLARAIPRLTPAISTTQGKNGGNRAGLYVIDFAEDGKVGSFLDTRGFSALDLFLSWDGANTTDLIRVLSNIVVPNVR